MLHDWKFNLPLEGFLWTRTTLPLKTRNLKWIWMSSSIRSRTITSSPLITHTSRAISWRESLQWSSTARYIISRASLFILNLIQGKKTVHNALHKYAWRSLLHMLSCRSHMQVNLAETTAREWYLQAFLSSRLIYLFCRRCCCRPVVALSWTAGTGMMACLLYTMDTLLLLRFPSRSV